MILKGTIKNRAICIILVLTLIACMMTVPVSAVTYSKDEISTAEWYHDYIDTQEAWDLLDKVFPDKSGRERVIVASIDSGCDMDDTELTANLDREHSVQFSAKDGKIGVPYEKGATPHGINLARTIAATSNNGYSKAGVAAGNNNDIVSFMAIHVYSDGADGYGDCDQRYTTTDDIIKGMNYAAENGAKVIQMCLGHDRYTRDTFGKKFNDKKLKKAIRKIIRKYDVVIVASAGNRGNTAKWYPSDIKGVLSTINTRQYTDIKSKKVKAGASSYGKRKAFSAPGYNGGTSTASAVAAGVVALVRYANPKLNAKQVANIVKSTATDLYKKGRDKRTGYGNVNAYAAVAKALKKAGYKGFPSRIAAPECEAQLTEINTTSVGAKKIKLKWSAATSSNGYVNGYKVWRAAKKDGKYRKIGSTKKTSYTDKKCKSGKCYYYKVVPYGTSLDGKVMAPSSVKKAKAVNAVAYGEKPRVKLAAKTENSITLAWKKVKKSNCEIQYSTSEKFDDAATLVSVAGGHRMTISGLKPDTTYYVRARRYRTIKGNTYYTAWTVKTVATTSHIEPTPINPNDGWDVIIG